MALILHIETAVETASVCLAKNGQLINASSNNMQKDHAAWIHEAIQNLLTGSQNDISQLNAIAVSAGPGSYTGLRVGMATAKGLCYALNIPLISIDTLMIMAKAALVKMGNEQMPQGYLLVPLIDARRMEVFAAVFDQALNYILPARAIVIDEFSFASLTAQPLVLFGNGSEKCRPLLQQPSIVFKPITFNAVDMIALAYDRFMQGTFTELAYSEPLYIKPFYTPDKKI